MDEVEAVARAICATRGLSPDALYQHHEWEPWPIDRRDEYVGLGGEVRINLMHYAWRRHTERAQAAIAALDAERGKAEPVAWMYRAGPYLRKYGPDLPPVVRLAFDRWSIGVQKNWVETPLYAHPPAPDAARGDPVARVVEWINERFDPDSWGDSAVRDIRDGILRGEPFNG